MNISNSGGVLPGKTNPKLDFLKNVMGLWIIQQCKKVWNKTEPELDYAEIWRNTRTESKTVCGYDRPGRRCIPEP